MNNVLELSDRARLFAAEYLVDFNVTRAAERAGISHNHGQQLMRDPRVDALIQEGKRKSALRLAISADATLNGFRMIANADIVPVLRALMGAAGEYDELDETGRHDFIWRLEQLPDEIRYSIKAIKWTKSGPEIVLHDKVAALTAIGRYFGLFTDNLNIRAPDGIGIKRIEEQMTPKEAADLYQRTLEADQAA